MNEYSDEKILENNEIERSLAALPQVKAPATLLPAVLMRVGLADNYARVETFNGPFFIAFNEYGVAAVQPARDNAEFEQSFSRRFGRPARYTPKLPATLGRAITARLNGDRQAKIEFDLRGLSEFEQAVLRKALEIPRGEVRPYAWIAKEIGKPKAVRAVGSALGANPIPLLIPCHRVVRSDGRLGGYALGPERKHEILAAEGVQLEKLENLSDHGVRFYGSDTTHIYCYPTCRHARRVTDQHRMYFPSEAAAHNAGYRPCKVCKPTIAA